MQERTTSDIYIGLDVSKDTLEACLSRQTGKPQHKTFANTLAGHQKLLRWAGHLAAGQSCHFALEATGAYSQGIAEFLAEAGQRVSVLNPARVKYSGIATGQGNKTDGADAKTIAHYCRLHAPPLWKQARPEVRLLTGLVRRLQSVKEMRVQEKNRLQLPGHSEPVRRSIEESIAFQDRQIADLQRQITEHIEGTPGLKADKELLTSIPGIGEVAAQQILAELPDVAEFACAESAAAFAGLAPAEFRSGTSVHKRTRLSKAGSRHLRQAVYFPAVTAIRHNPLVRALYERLIASGKARMAAVGAAMRKVLMLAFGVLKNRRPFDPEWASRQARARA